MSAGHASKPGLYLPAPPADFLASRPVSKGTAVPTEHKVMDKHVESIKALIGEGSQWESISG
jgi:hypothetical protein